MAHLKWTILVLVFWASFAQAAERYEFYHGIRQMGMGGAIVAVVNDETALLSNPAALGKLRDHFITLIDPEIEFNGHFTNAYKNRNVLDLVTPGGLIQAAQDFPDTHYHAGAKVFPSLVLPNFGFGVLANFSYDATSDGTGANVDIRYRNDYAAVIGYNLRLWGGRIKIGFSAKAVNRTEYVGTLPTSDTNYEWKDLVAEGGALAVDAGLILTAPWDYLPSIAGVVRDVGDTAYDAGGGFMYDTTRRPENKKQTVDAGFSITPILANRTRMQITGEYRDVMNVAEEKDIYRRIHAGIEFNFADMFFLRGGMNQRYWTAGLEFAIQRFQFQAASYGEDIGADEDPKEDRRYMGKFVFRF
jgi:hypothetical protein